ncbi:MAG: hypothetical protein II395_04905 [Ruminococcus sp.]|nr:hypothetical protein [Ruminococcus sp.]
MMKIKPIMTAAYAAALVLGAAACGAPTPVSKADMLGTTASDTTETGAATAAVTTVAPTTEAPARRVEDYVITAKERQIAYNGAFQLTGEEPRTSETATARLPELRLDNPDAAAVNAEIHERLDSLFNGYDNNGYVNARADYTAALNGNQILSLAVETRSVDTPNSFFMVYNFNVETGNRLTRDEVAAIAGTTTQDVLGEIIDDINTRCDNLDVSGGMLDQMERSRARSLAQENLDQAQFFFDENGVLNAVYRYYWIAGAENYGALLKTSFVCQLQR